MTKIDDPKFPNWGKENEKKVTPLSRHIKRMTMAKIKNHQKGSLLKNEDMLNIFLTMRMLKKSLTNFLLARPLPYHNKGFLLWPTRHKTINIVCTHTLRP